MGLMLEVTSGGTSFLDMVSNFFTKSLSWGTQLFNWVVTTEPVNYFVGISLICGVIVIIHKVKRG